MSYDQYNLAVMREIGRRICTLIPEVPEGAVRERLEDASKAIEQAVVEIRKELRRP